MYIYRKENEFFASAGYPQDEILAEVDDATFVLSYISHYDMDVDGYERVEERNIPRGIGMPMDRDYAIGWLIIGRPTKAGRQLLWYAPENRKKWQMARARLKANIRNHVTRVKNDMDKLAAQYHKDIAALT